MASYRHRGGRIMIVDMIIGAVIGWIIGAVILIMIYRLMP